MIRKKVLSKSPQETIKISKDLVATLDNNMVNIFITGELGAGKTKFTQGIFESLGIKEGAVSPTFELVSSYKTSSGIKVNHLDLYRLNILSMEDELWLEEILEEPSINIVEWADKFDLKYSKKQSVYVSIKKLEDEESREIEISIY